ncbi:gap junction delta-4 protein-like [Salvelinus fontinalis]|uniref:gap junction delta-4 protein-like n=1 Tax=Salvelinus fontinalis TaxID=8038 RepID=UPI0024864B38|nr:gap junction delta-4 protein-like [Salvelinus fontinalis]
MEKTRLMEMLFITFNHNVTFLGKMWLILMVVLRLLILLFSGYPLFRDEQERFVCNTIQPGCTNVCFDGFAPLSLFRFWLFQLIMLCLPHMMFISYIVHKVSSALRIGGNYSPGSRSPVGALCTHQHSLPKGTPNFLSAYLLDLLLRILLEAAFSAGQYYLYGFSVPRRFQCYESPCTSMVECYISSPTEKTIMLNFMLGAASLSLLLSLADLMCSVQRMVTQGRREEKLKEGGLFMNGRVGEDIEVLYAQNALKTVLKRSHIDKPTSRCIPNSDLSHGRVRINNETQVRVAAPPLQGRRPPRRAARMEPPQPFQPIPMGAQSNGRFVHPNHISHSSPVPLSRRLERNQVVVSRQSTPSPMNSSRRHGCYNVVDTTLLEQHYDSAESRDRLQEEVILQEVGVRGTSSSSSGSSSSSDAQ